MALTKGCTFSTTGGAAGSDLSAYSLAGEAAWTKHASHATGAIILSDAERARGGSANIGLYYTDETPTSADYTVTMEFRHFSSPGFGIQGVAGRINTAASTLYYAFYNATAGEWQLVRRLAGALRYLGAVPATLVAGQSYELSITFRGTVITLHIDGVEVIRAFDSGITDAGRAGIYSVGNTTNTTSHHFDNFAVSEPAVAATDVVITSPAAYQIIQRDPDTNTADIAIEGTYTGSPTAIEARWNGGAWTTIDAAPAAGAFSGTLSGQTAGQGTLEVRWTNDMSKTASAEYVGIGEVFAIAGQSNAVGQGSPLQHWTHPTLKAGVFRNNNQWDICADNPDDAYGQVDSISSDAGGEGGTAWAKMITDLMDSLGVPIGLVPCAKGATTILAWQPGADHLDRSTLYGSLNYRIGLAGGVRMVLWWQGETDAQGGTTQADYNARLDALADALMTDRGVKLMPCKLQTMTDAGTTSEEQATIRAAIDEAWNDNDNVLPGPDLVGLTTDDGQHLKSTANLTAAGELWAAAIEAEILVNNDVTYYINGNFSNFSGRLHQLGRTEADIEAFISEGSGHLANWTVAQKISNSKEVNKRYLIIGLPQNVTYFQ